MGRLSKRTRFSVFHRDAFTCVYCGATPPGVVLEVDHRVALANGGMDDESNLVTACFDCNRGKCTTTLEHPVGSGNGKKPQTPSAYQPLAGYFFIAKKRSWFGRIRSQIGEKFVVAETFDPLVGTPLWDQVVAIDDVASEGWMLIDDTEWFDLKCGEWFRAMDREAERQERVPA